MAAPSQGILSLNIKDKSALYAAYMPYVKNGGLFIPTSKQYSLGDEVFMLLSLMDSKERLPVAGKIIWVTPQGAQSRLRSGRTRDPLVRVDGRNHAEWCTRHVRERRVDG